MGGKAGESVMEKEGINATAESGGISHENYGDTGCLIRSMGFCRRWYCELTVGLGSDAEQDKNRGFGWDSKWISGCRGSSLILVPPATEGTVAFVAFWDSKMRWTHSFHVHVMLQNATNG